MTVGFKRRRGRSSNRGGALNVFFSPDAASAPGALIFRGCCVVCALGEF